MEKSENSEEIFKDIVNDIVDKMFMQENSLKRKHCEDGNSTAAKRNDA